MERSSCPAGSRPGDALEAAHLERSRGDDDDGSVWTWRTCCALSDADSSCASHPPDGNRHPRGSSAGETGFSVRGDHLNVENRSVSVGREVSAHSSRNPPSSLHPRCLQLRCDDGDCGGCGDRVDHDPSARTCG